MQLGKYTVPTAVVWQSIMLPLHHASSTALNEKETLLREELTWDLLQRVERDLGCGLIRLTLGRRVQDTIQQHDLSIVKHQAASIHQQMGDATTEDAAHGRSEVNQRQEEGLDGVVERL